MPTTKSFFLDASADARDGAARSVPENRVFYQRFDDRGDLNLDLGVLPVILFLPFSLPGLETAYAIISLKGYSEVPAVKRLKELFLETAERTAQTV